MTQDGYTRSETACTLIRGRRCSCGLKVSGLLGVSRQGETSKMRQLTIFTVCLLVLAACASADVFDFSYAGSNLWDSTTTCLGPLNNCTRASGKLVANLIGVNTWQ